MDQVSRWSDQRLMPEALLWLLLSEADPPFTSSFKVQTLHNHSSLCILEFSLFILSSSSGKLIFLCSLYSSSHQFISCFRRDIHWILHKSFYTNAILDSTLASSGNCSVVEVFVDVVIGLYCHEKSSEHELHSNLIWDFSGGFTYDSSMLRWLHDAIYVASINHFKNRLSERSYSKHSAT